jgi:hypothetical protein
MGHKIQKISIFYKNSIKDAKNEQHFEYIYHTFIRILTWGILEWNQNVRSEGRYHL